MQNKSQSEYEETVQENTATKAYLLAAKVCVAMELIVFFLANNWRREMMFPFSFS
jgi:hypothetical protein